MGVGEYIKSLFRKKASTEANGHDAPFDILSLSGGGIMGLYTARILQHLEEDTGVAAGNHFSMLCGTSIGGILALGLSREVPAEKIVQSFIENTADIFKPRSLTLSGKFLSTPRLRQMAQSLKRTTYEADNLHKVVKEFLGEDTTLGQVVHPVVITAYDLTTGSPRIFSAPITKNGAFHDLDIHLHDIAMATSAIPAVFPIHEIDGHKYVDGGIFANCPDVLAFREAIFTMSVPMDKIRMCSIGTMTGRFIMDENVPKDAGLRAWGEKNRLPTLMMASQQQFTVNWMKDIIGENYIRIDSIHPDMDGNMFDPSKASKEDLQVIINSADRAWKVVREEKLIRDILAK